MFKSKNQTEDRTIDQTENRARNMRKFNKVEFLISVGLLNAKFNYETLKFERSAYLRWKCYLNTLLKASFPFKMFFSVFFAREDLIQL